MTFNPDDVKEKWGAITGFPLYQVSTFGRIKSLSRTIFRSHPQHQNITQKIVIKEKIIKGWIKYSSYTPSKPDCVLVTLRNKNKSFIFRVHSLVLEAFARRRPDDMEGCHDDGNPLNNHINNLRWDTHKANMDDCLKHNTKSKPPIHRGESHPKVTISDEDVRKIRSTPFTYGTQSKLARQYNVSDITISRIKKGLSRNG